MGEFQNGLLCLALTLALPKQLWKFIADRLTSGQGLSGKHWCCPVEFISCQSLPLKNCQGKLSYLSSNTQNNRLVSFSGNSAGFLDWKWTVMFSREKWEHSVAAILLKLSMQCRRPVWEWTLWELYNRLRIWVSFDFFSGKYYFSAETWSQKSGNPLKSGEFHPMVISKISDWHSKFLFGTQIFLFGCQLALKEKF